MKKEKFFTSFLNEFLIVSIKSRKFINLLCLKPNMNVYNLRYGSR